MGVLRPLDTSEEAWSVYLNVLRRMPPERRFEIGLELNALSRRLLEAGVRARHPEYTDEQVRLAVIRLLLPEDLFRAAYPGAEVLPP